MGNSDGQGPDAHRMSAGAATTTWLVLVAATIAGWLLAGTHGSGQLRLAAIVLLACIKIYLVMAVFMGLRRAPHVWHLAAIAWVVLTGGAIFALASGAAA
jgi:heme/copper-type cytochrome/quinol oxidase subunit 4